ncbi:MAG: hypothetical protein ACFCUU_09165 [Cyclobacteriaceae bacterium]
MARLTSLTFLLVLFSCTEREFHVVEQNTDDLSTYEDLSNKQINSNLSTGSRFFCNGDPNLNPNWDWKTDPVNGHEMWYNPNGTDPIQLITPTPFFTPGNILNTGAGSPEDKDFWPEDGWMLAYKDFGSPDCGAPEYPFFALYNKYRGILRIMFYNASSREIEFFQVTAKLKSDLMKTPIFTFTSEQKSFLNEYDPNQVEMFTGLVDAKYRDWGVIDLIIAGYDPNLSSKNSVLELSISSIDQYQMNVKSTEFTSYQIIDKAPSHASKSNGSQENDIEIFNSGSKFYDNVEMVRKSVNELAENPINNGAWWTQKAMDLANDHSPTIVPFIAPLLGKIDQFIGGKKKASPREPLKFKGILPFEGRIIKTNNVLEISLALNPGPLSHNYYRPVQTIPWGVFNLTSKPNLEVSFEDSYNCANDLFNIGYTFNGSMDIVFNPNIGSKVQSKRVLFLYNNDLSRQSSWHDLNSINSYASYDDYSGSYVPKYQIPFAGNSFVPSAMALELTTKINTPVKNSDDEIVFYKVYPIHTYKTWHLECEE